MNGRGSGNGKGEEGRGKGMHPAKQMDFTTNEDTETMSNRETERQRHGDTDGTKETEDVPPIAVSVKTLQEAVPLSLKDGLNKDGLFTFARAVKAFEINPHPRLPQAEMQASF